MKLEEVQELWAKDCNIDKDHPECLDGGSLHSKYMNILGIEKRRNKKLQDKKIQLKFWLDGYYKDGLYTEELQRRPSPKLAKSNDERDRMVAIDPTMSQLNDLILESDEILNLCLQAIQYIQYNRSKDIKNYIEWTKFRAGAL